MVISEYYETLGIPLNSSIGEIKRAYREKARLYHPDINQDPAAMDLFIRATEAYDFLIANYGKGTMDDQEYFRIVEEWRKYRQDRSRQRAQFYARKSYSQFKNTNYYKSTKILNGAPIIFNFSIALMVLVFTVTGYIFKIHDPVPGEEASNLLSFILLLVISLILLGVSFLYLKSYIEICKKSRKKKDAPTDKRCYKSASY